MKALLTLINLALAVTISGQNISLVSDINTTSNYINDPSDLFLFNNRLYIGLGDYTYLYDGLQMASLAYKSETHYPCKLNNKLYFSTFDNANRGVLWEYDGKNQPVMIADFYGASGYSMPYSLCGYNNKLYFSEYDDIHGSELWVYDGSGPPHMVTDIDSGSASSNPQALIEFNDRLYFTANDGELWMYDDTYPPARVAFNGTILSRNLTIFDNNLCFAATDVNNAAKLWTYDGTNAPKLINGLYSSSPEDLTLFNNKLYFNADDSIQTYQIWVYDGIHPPAIENDFKGDSDIVRPHILKAFNDKLYFTSENYSINYSLDLWEYDGLVPAKMIASHQTSGYISFIEFNHLIYYKTHTPHASAVLWKCDGINAPELASLGMTGWSNPYGKTLFNNKLYFMAHDGTHGNNLWEYDDVKLPSMVTETNFDSDGSGDIQLFVVNNRLFLCNNYKIWVYDGINPPVEKARIDVFFTPYIFNNKLYFVSRYLGGFALWSFDGTNNPVVVANIESNSSSWTDVSLTVMDNKLYFNAWDSNHGTELWVYDGTNPATIAFDIIQGIAGSGPYNLAVYKNKLFFSASDGTHGNELWGCDGISPPLMIDDINMGDGSSNPSELTVYNNRLFFEANSMLWMFNGTDKPAIVPGDYSASEDVIPRNLFIYNNKLIFVSYDGVYGYEPWEYDGTNPPKMLRDLNFGSSYHLPDDFTIFKNKLYFIFEYEPELWEYDGINLPSIVQDVNGEYSGTDPEDLIVFKDKIFFTATQYGPGRELFVMTPANTYSNILITACNSYTSPSGIHTWQTSGTYTDTIPNAAGCDSIITLNLTINKVDVAVYLVDNALIAATGNFQYQWADCSNAFQPVPGETNQSFLASEDGSYAVIVYQENCVDTSACYDIHITGSLDYQEKEEISFYPNPAKSEITLTLKRIQESGIVEIFDLKGELMNYKEFPKSAEINLDISGLDRGVYVVRFRNDRKVITQKMIKE